MVVDVVDIGVVGGDIVDAVVDVDGVVGDAGGGWWLLGCQTMLLVVGC